MPSNAVNDIRGNGTMRRKGGTTSGPADQFQSQNAIASDGVITLVGNAGSDRARVYGDGRHWTPVQGFTPGVLVPGQFFVETYLGVDWWVFVDSAGVAQRIRPISTISVDIFVPVGPAVALDILIVDNTRFAVYQYTAYNATTGAQEGGTIQLGHNGSTGGDATVSQIGQVIGVALGIPQVTFDTTLAGVGPAQTLTFEATATAAGWAVAYTRTMSA